MENKKKLAAALAAVTAYIKTEEEAAMAMALPKVPPHHSVLPITLWGMSGRQAIMQNRNLMQLKTFHRPGLR
jgi:hypothetical protein